MAELIMALTLGLMGSLVPLLSLLLLFLIYRKLEAIERALLEKE